MTVRLLTVLTTWIAAILVATGTFAQSNSAPPQVAGKPTYSLQEIIDAGHTFFGTATGGIAEAVESVFARHGRPNAYIVGEEASGSFVGGLRYGEGFIFPKAGGRQKLFWQGPSFGLDFGGNGSRVIVLVYNLNRIRDLYKRLPGVEGSAYIIGGFGVNIQQRGRLVVAPIRTGVGARLGVNVGYLKYTAKPTWNPF